MADKKDKKIEDVEQEVKDEKVETTSEENVDEANVEEAGAEETGANETAEEAGGDTDKNNKYQAQIDELNDKCMRQMAEFENFRKRTDKEKMQMFETGAKSVIEKILPVVDNFERGIAALTEEEKEGSFAKGMQGIYKQLVDELDKMEVKPIEAVGKEFDPNLHNAVMQTESDEYESGIVAQELQKGYTYREQVVRHSMVAVVQ